jgi:CubicO group peptidase (beta-lactamase class C family)
MLIDEGKLDPEDLVSKYLSGCRTRGTRCAFAIC